MFKRDSKLFLGCLLSVLIGTLLLAGVSAAAAAFAIRSAGQLISPVRVAVVDEEDTVQSRLLVHTVSGNEMFTSSAEPVVLPLSEAMAELESGGVSGVIILPDGFTASIAPGEELHGKIMLSEALSSHSDVIGTLAAFGEEMLAAGQNGVFAGMEALEAGGVPEAVVEAFRTAGNPMQLSEALAVHEKYLDVEVVPYLDTAMPTGNFYACAFVVLGLFLTGIFFTPLFTRDRTEAMLDRLASCGVGSGKFYRWKLVLTAGFRVLLAIAAAAVLTRFGLAALSISTVWWILPAAAYCALISACLTVCFGDGVTAAAAFGLGGLFLIGGVLPRQMLPDWLTAIGDLSPFGAAEAWLAPVFGGKPDLIPLLASLVWAALAIVLLGGTRGTRGTRPFGKGNAAS